MWPYLKGISLADGARLYGLGDSRYHLGWKVEEKT